MTERAPGAGLPEGRNVMASEQWVLGLEAERDRLRVENATLKARLADVVADGLAASQDRDLAIQHAHQAEQDLAAAQARAGALEAALCRYWAGDSCNCEPPFAVLCPNCEAAQALAALPPRAGEASHE